MSKAPKPERATTGKNLPPEAFEFDHDFDPDVLDRYDDDYVNELEEMVSELEANRPKEKKK